jgi:RecB family exonuclease
METTPSPSTAFNWTINESRLWPPRGRPHPPFGPTLIEIMRSCSLRVCFDTSKGYERRTAHAARIGSAFHRTLQSLTEQPISSSSPQEIVDEASRRFREALASQEAKKQARPREQMLARNEERVQRALESLAVEALRLAKYVRGEQVVFSAQQPQLNAFENQQLSVSGHEHEERIMVEIPVQSEDGLLAGRIDYAERLPDGGIRLLDYKSALRDDLPERYERQLQMYAFLWYETFGEWPTEALVIYPFTGTTHKVAVDPAICQQVGQEARLIAEQLQEDVRAEQLASPGTVCTVCEFRPWCKPFWRWQAGHAVYSQALETAAYGFEGTIVTLEIKDHHWKVVVKWREAEIRIVAPQARFPQLEKAHPGMRIRALDMRLYGQRYRPQAIVSENSEIFLIE